MLKIHKSLINDNIVKMFKMSLGDDLYQVAQNRLDVEQFISVSALLWPIIIEENSYVFLAANRKLYTEIHDNQIKTTIEDLEKKYNNEKKQIEMRVNAVNISQLLWGEQIAERNGYKYLKGNEELNYDKLIPEVGKILEYFWDLRLKTLFPEKRFIINLEQNLFGEDGLCITFSED